MLHKRWSTLLQGIVSRVSFIGQKKQQWRNGAWVPGVAYLTLFRKIEEQGDTYRAQSWLGIWVLADWMDILRFWSHGACTGKQVWFVDVEFWAGAAPSWA